MRNLDLKNFPIANKEIEEFKRCNAKNILELNFKENSFKDIDISSFDNLRKKEFNTIFYVNGKLYYKNLESEIELKDEKLRIDGKDKKPILILNLYSDTNTLFHKKIEFLIENNIEIVELFISLDKENFIDEKRDFNINENSKVEYIKLQKLSIEDFLQIKFRQNLKKSAKLKIFNFDYGSSNSYNIFDTNLNFDESTFEVEAFLNITKKQEIANIVNTTHNGKNTNSSIKANHILNQSSHAIFEVKSRVNKSAKYSNVIQNSKTTILSDDAKINANPRLEIFCDELSASHGTSTGSLDEDILYYLQTRGLSKEKASKILLDAIKDKIINSIENEEIKTLIKEI